MTTEPPLAKVQLTDGLGRHLEVRDRPGSMKVSLIRHYFEGAVTQTATLAEALPLHRVAVAGEFQEYMRPETQAAWVGFAIGMRCAERLQAAFEAQSNRPGTSALDSFKECGGHEEPNPLERLRFFCSLAMSGQDWLDVEPFFDDVAALLPAA